MRTFRCNCPHCKVKEMNFAVLNKYQMSTTPRDVYAFAKCGKCEKAIVAVFDDPIEYSTTEEYLRDQLYYQLKAVYPDPRRGIPRHVPEIVGKSYLKAVENIQDDPTMAGMMFRKTLEDILKEINPEGANKRLGEQVHLLVKTSEVTKNLEEWADRIRLVGNKTTHGEPFTLEEVKELAFLTHLLMLYLFTLPGVLAENRSTTNAS